MDEYTSAHLTVTQLNQMCDGTYQYPIKGGDAKGLALTLVVCGNSAPEQVYPNRYPLVQARFQE